MSWLTSDTTSAIRISSRSSLAPARLRTTIRPGSSSITVGGVIQFCGLKPPESAWTITEPSSLSMSSRSASGQDGAEPAGVDDLAAGDDQAHRGEASPAPGRRSAEQVGSARELVGRPAGARRGRSWWSPRCVLALALVAGYAKRAALDSDQFANRATERAPRRQRPRPDRRAKITDDVVLAPRGGPARGPADHRVGGRRGGRVDARSPACSAAPCATCTGLVFDRDQGSVTLTVGDVGTVLAEALEVAPGLAREVRATERVEVVRRDLGRRGPELAGVADEVRFLFGAAARARARRGGGRARALVRTAARTVGASSGGRPPPAGVLLVVALGVLRSLALDLGGRARGPRGGGAVWDALPRGPAHCGVDPRGCGAVVAAAAPRT